MEKTENKRIFQYDVMRVIAMLMMLGVHGTNIVAYKDCIGIVKYPMQAMNDFFLICNPIFFMIAGKFNLKYKFESKKDYKDFYLKKFVTIFIPFLIISIIQYIIMFWNELNIQDFLIKFATNKVFYTNWFVYAYLCLILFTPFLSKIVNNLNEAEKRILLIICFLANFAVVYLNFFGLEGGITFQYLGFAFWHIFYLAGYIIDDVIKTKKARNITIWLGIIAFVLQIIIRMSGHYEYNLTDPSPLLILEAFGAYFFIKEYVKINNNKEQRIISFIAKYSYPFYLCHGIIYNILSYIVKTLPNNRMLEVYLFEIGMYIIAFTITLIVCIVFSKLIIEPIKKSLLK